MTDYIVVIINGIFNGLGTGIGSWMALRGVVAQISKIPALQKKVETLKNDIVEKVRR